MAGSMRLPRKKSSTGEGTGDKGVAAPPLPRSGTNRSSIFLGGEAPTRPRTRTPQAGDNTLPSPRAVERETSRGANAKITRNPRVSLLAVDDDEDEIIDDAPSGISLLASSEEWDDDETTDTTLGLGSEGTRDSEVGVNHKTGIVKNRKKRVQLTERDIAIIRLLGKYKFGYRTQIESFCDRKDLSRRLTQLGNAGLIRSEKITQNQAVWTPTQAGIEITGLEVSTLTHGRIQPTTIAHTVGLLNLGIGFEKGDPRNNLLRDASWPCDWRKELNRDQISYRLERGETVVTERMVERSWKRQLAMYGEDDLVYQFQQAMAWRPRAGATGLDLFGPESEEGNEWMFTGMPPYKAHIPDMVLVRPRNPDGSVQHVAIELELSSKSIPEWRRILEGFKASEAFKTVAYFTHKRTVKDGLLAVNKNHVGLDVGSELLMMKYVPRVDNLPFWG